MATVVVSAVFEREGDTRPFHYTVKTASGVHSPGFHSREQAQRSRAERIDNWRSYGHEVIERVNVP